jgi:hypothetical protein
LSELARTILSNSRFSGGRSSSGESQVLQHYLGQMFVAAGDAFAGDADLRCEINEALRRAAQLHCRSEKRRIHLHLGQGEELEP